MNFNSIFRSTFPARTILAVDIVSLLGFIGLVSYFAAITHSGFSGVNTASVQVAVGLASTVDLMLPRCVPRLPAKEGFDVAQAVYSMVACGFTRYLTVCGIVVLISMFLVCTACIVCVVVSKLLLLTVCLFVDLLRILFWVVLKLSDAVGFSWWLGWLMVSAGVKDFMYHPQAIVPFVPRSLLSLESSFSSSGMTFAIDSMIKTAANVALGTSGMAMVSFFRSGSFYYVGTAMHVLRDVRLVCDSDDIRLYREVSGKDGVKRRLYVDAPWFSDTWDFEGSVPNIDVAVRRLSDYERGQLSKIGVTYSKVTSVKYKQGITTVAIVSSPEGVRMMRCIGNPEKRDAFSFYHSCMTVPGCSGAPIYVMRNKELVLCGIHTAAVPSMEKNLAYNLNIVFAALQKVKGSILTAKFEDSPENNDDGYTYYTDDMSKFDPNNPLFDKEPILVNGEAAWRITQGDYYTVVYQDEYSSYGDYSSGDEDESQDLSEISAVSRDDFRVQDDDDTSSRVSTDDTVRFNDEQELEAAWLVINKYKKEANVPSSLLESRFDPVPTIAPVVKIPVATAHIVPEAAVIVSKDLISGKAVFVQVGMYDFQKKPPTDVEFETLGFVPLAVATTFDRSFAKPVTINPVTRAAFEKVIPADEMKIISDTSYPVPGKGSVIAAVKASMKYVQGKGFDPQRQKMAEAYYKVIESVVNEIRPHCPCPRDAWDSVEPIRLAEDIRAYLDSKKAPTLAVLSLEKALRTEFVSYRSNSSTMGENYKTYLAPTVGEVKVDPVMVESVVLSSLELVWKLLRYDGKSHTMEEYINDGVYPVGTVSLKMEPHATSKVVIGRFRYVTSYQIPFVLIYKVCLMFIQHGLRDNLVQSGSMCGYDPANQDHRNMIGRFAPSDLRLTGDVTAADVCTTREDTVAVAEVQIGLINPRQSARAALARTWLDLFNDYSLVNIDGDLYRDCTGNGFKSGRPDTSLEHYVKHRLLAHVAAAELAVNPPRTLTMGDDFLYRLERKGPMGSKRAKSKPAAGFTTPNLLRVYAESGWILTDLSKDLNLCSKAFVLEGEDWQVLPLNSVKMLAKLLYKTPEFILEHALEYSQEFRGTVSEPPIAYTRFRQILSLLGTARSESNTEEIELQSMSSKGKKTVAKIIKQIEGTPSKKNSGRQRRHKARKVKKAVGALAPLAMRMLPMLLANPTAPGGAPSRNLTRLAATAPAAVGLAPSLGNDSQTGIWSQKALKDISGKVIGMNLQGREILGTILWPNNSAAGDLVYQLVFNPMSGQLQNTRLALVASGFSRYKPRELVAVVDSSQAAIQPGQLTMAFLVDPEQVVPLTGGGANNIRVLGDSEGSDVFQIYSRGCAFWPETGFNTTPFFTNPQVAADSTDPTAQYLVSAGQLCIATNLANTSGADIPVGTVSIAYNIDFFQPTMEANALISKRARILGGTGALSCTDTAPLGLAVPPVLDVGDSIGITNLAGGGFSLPTASGAYLAIWSQAVVTSLSTSAGALEAAFGTGGITNVEFYVSAYGGGFTLWTRFEVTGAGAVDLSACSTGITGDNVSVNMMVIMTDPFAYPTASRSASAVARENANVKIRCEAALALARESELEKKVHCIEERLGLVKLDPVAAVQVLPSMSSASLASFVKR